MINKFKNWYDKQNEEYEKVKEDNKEKFKEINDKWEQTKEDCRKIQTNTNKPCKVCGSTNFTRQAITVRKKKSMLLAIILLLVFLPAGLVYLLIGRKERTEVVAICNNCGTQK